MVEEKDATIASIRDEISRNDHTIRDLEGEISALRSSVEKKVAKREADTLELFNLNKMIDALNNEADEYKKKAAEKDVVIDNLKTHHKKLTDQIDELKNLIKKLAEQAQDKEDLAKKIVDLQKQIRDLQAKLGFEISLSDKANYGRGNRSGRDGVSSRSGMRGNRVIATEGSNNYFVGKALKP
jgi:chromosome segregation ATPase